MVELKDFLIVGILGSLWVKIVEWYFQINNGFITWAMLFGTFGFIQLLYLIFLSGVISWAFYELFKNKGPFPYKSMAFIPITWYYVKDVYNVVFAKVSIGILPYTFVEGILFAIPIGFAVYYIYDYYTAIID